jgi:hypothetical protein
MRSWQDIYKLPVQVLRRKRAKMVNVKITFQKCIHDSQEYGSNDEYMVSRVFFDIEVDGENKGEFSTDVKQAVGGDYETTPLEVDIPKDYKGPLRYRAFRKAVEDYYRSQVGSLGHGIHIEGGGNIRMHIDTFIATKIVEFEAEDS